VSQLSHVVLQVPLVHRESPAKTELQAKAAQQAKIITLSIHHKFVLQLILRASRVQLDNQVPRDHPEILDLQDLMEKREHQAK